jgi:integrase/recombinase XerD
MSQSITINDAIHDFLQAGQADGLRPASIRWYAAILKMFVESFEGRILDSITTAELRAYVIGLRTRTERHATSSAVRPKLAGGLSESSIAGHLRALHRFWNWSAGEYKITNPMKNIRRPARRNPDPKGISIDDLKALFEAAGGGQAGARDRAILAFLIDTGCRAQGLLELTLDRLDIPQSRAIVWEKGQKSRTVFFTPLTGNLLKAWAAVRPADCTTAFCSLSNRFMGKPLSYEGLTQILARLKERAGIKGRVNAHSFRHGFARQYIMNGGDLSTLSRLMGHSDTAVTAWYYAVFTSSELADIHARYSPLHSVLGNDADGLPDTSD